MKQPIIELSKWPLGESLIWFNDKSNLDIISNQEERFKQHLKENSLKVITNLNKSFQEKIDAWCYLKGFQDCFDNFLKAAIRLALSNDLEFKLQIAERYQILTFLNYTFNSIEVDFVHLQIRKYLPLSIWKNLSQTRREMELDKLNKRIRLAWNKIEQQDATLNIIELQVKTFEREFMFKYIKQFFDFLEIAVILGNQTDQDANMEVGGELNTSEDTKLNDGVVLYCQRFIEFVIDIESQLPLRRFFHAILDYTHFIPRCQLSNLCRHKSPEGHLFEQLIDLLVLYTRYDLDMMSGEPFTENEILKKHEEKILGLQKVLWSKYTHMKKYSIQPIKAIDNPNALFKIITSFDSREDLIEFLKTLKLVDDKNLDEYDKENAPLLASIMMNNYRRYDSQMKKINSIPLFPNESIIWDTNLVPEQYYNYEYSLALPKLNLQYLTMSDYLLRNFMLFKNESTYEIRQDIEDAIIRSKCKWTAEGNFATGPKQRMALILKDFSILEVEKPKLGEDCPSKVRAKIIINMDYVKPEWKREWEQLRKHDTCFLVSFRKLSDPDPLSWPEGTFPQKNSVKYVRGCEIEGLLDSDGKLVDENLEKPNYTNNLRTFLILLDCNQYRIDQNQFEKNKVSVYDKFHLIVRRKPEKNNFKGVLETIRSLINTKFVVPEWLNNLLLGFGNPADAHHSNFTRDKNIVSLDYHDTFLDYQHLCDSFAQIKSGYKLIYDNNQSNTTPKPPPYIVEVDDEKKILVVIPYEIPSPSPYPTMMPKKNLIKFTPTQVEAITSGIQRGLTMVVGPPGTGKTDVAVQILSNLYHSNPQERTLIVTHSNQALNQIFEKMIELDVKEHHLLRMGHGEEDLQSTKDFSRQGRVKYVLQKRLELLILVSKIARSLNLDPGDGFTCQSASYFNSYHVVSRWREYISLVRNTTNVQDIGDKFPFKKFFDDAPQPLFKNRSIEEDLKIAETCYRYIEGIFTDLRSFRPFEIFSNSSDRSKYLLIREAKVIAMTCTHAGLRRKELVDMNFQYDNILMEETAQILEIETTIPLLLQNPENGVNRLKRWIMIGDHNQLPPIIQNSAFQKFSNLEQSLFARFIRLGVPAIELDAQGRARPSIADLYRWRYNNLRDLEDVKTNVEYKRANTGFLYDYQLINVEDKVGETSPIPYYYQNRAEAEFLLATYKYMRTLGYPSEKITVLSTYNGQKQLLREIFNKECTSDAFLGLPSKITTVDKFQGQQNDYVLLSLVRTKTFGHLRDIRRLVVAMSRARLGLYIFGKVSLFSSCFELQNTMKLLLSRPQNLCLIKQREIYPTTNGRNIEELHVVSEDPSSVIVIRTLMDMQTLVNEKYQIFIEEQTRCLRSQTTGSGSCDGGSSPDTNQ